MSLANIYRLGLKELKSLWADKVLLLLICWAFSGAIYTAATATSQELHNAPVAVVDEDQSPLSRRIVGAFYKPYFRQPAALTLAELDREMDLGTYNFTLVLFTMTLIGVLGFVFDLILRKIQSRVLFWIPQTTRSLAR